MNSSTARMQPASSKRPGDGLSSTAKLPRVALQMMPPRLLAEKQKEQRLQREREERERKAREEQRRREKPAPLESLYANLPPPVSTETVQKAKVEEETAFADVDSKSVIFLDVDGVLRPAERGGSGTIFVDGEPVMASGNTVQDFLPTAMRALRRIVAETGARIVISSEWRKYANLRETVFASLRNTCRLPATRIHSDAWIPALDEIIRGEDHEEQLRCFAWRRTREIHMWLAKHPEVKNWVALDDVDLPGLVNRMQHETAVLRATAKRMLVHCVITDPRCGLVDGDAGKSVAVLRGEVEETSPSASP